MPASNNFITARLCATCDLHWPYHPDYIQCPQCSFNTILRSTKADNVMTPDEAKRLVSNISFERWVNEETDEARRIRESRARSHETESILARDTASQALKRRFDAVIDGGGFTQDEKEMFRAIERALPTIHPSQVIHDED